MPTILDQSGASILDELGSPLLDETGATSTTVTGGVTGWDLYSTLALQVEYKRYYDSQLPVACPHDGTPLLKGPAMQSDVLLYCPMGNYRYPEDWDPNTQSGM